MVFSYYTTIGPDLHPGPKVGRKKSPGGKFLRSPRILHRKNKCTNWFDGARGKSTEAQGLNEAAGHRRWSTPWNTRASWPSASPAPSWGLAPALLIRADGSPKYAMFSTLSGAVLNCILDPILIFRLGVTAGANQLTITLVQIVMNNILGYYGEMSPYGRDISLACVGIISKVSAIFNAVIFGISQSTQPILGYNYGARNYARVKETLKKAVTIVTGISCVAFLCFQIFPRQIVSMFGSGDKLYYAFALRYFHIFLFCTFLVGTQILCAQFFPSIGTVVSLSRQVFFLLPLVIVFPLIWGIDGVLWAGPSRTGCPGFWRCSLSGGK